MPSATAPCRPRTGCLLIAALALGACGGAPTRPAAALGGDDIRWLERVTYGVDSATVARYQHLGREAYLERELVGRGSLPRPASDELGDLAIARSDPEQILARVASERKRINALADSPEKDQARKALNARGNELADEAARRLVLRAIDSPAQLREQMVWFWLNHFSVFRHKGSVGWVLGDYEERAIRPHVVGRFRDLVMATLVHPAMLEYLDNAQNSAGHLNENYARELMELHVLGVNAGYTQQDVQALARILTGVGVSNGRPPPLLGRRLRSLYRRASGFEFNPARHDFSDKLLLGHTIRGRGFAEVEQAVDLLVTHPACAHYIAHKLAVFFVADEPPPGLVARAAATFSATGGDIAAVLRVVLLAPETQASLGTKFKDPLHFVASTLRFADDGRPILDSRPVIAWLNALGEPPYGHQTPDGYPLTEAGWASSGQMGRRLEIARAMGNSHEALFARPGAAGVRAPPVGAVPVLTTPLFHEVLEPRLSQTTRAALLDARSPLEWNTFLFASPEFNFR